MIFKKFEEWERVEPVNEGSMKEIFMLSKEAKSEEDFKNLLVDYYKSHGKEDLAANEEFVNNVAKEFYGRNEDFFTASKPFPFPIE